MVKYDRQPSIDGVAELTILSQSPFVDVVLRMASVTYPRCALEYIIDMAGCAVNSQMLARQRESGQAVVDRGLLPIIGYVTLGAVIPEISLVNIILCMA